MKNRLPFFAVLAVVLWVTAGCQDSAVSRQVTEAEVQESNSRREQRIDEMNIPDAQKEQMKARLGRTGESR